MITCVAPGRFAPSDPSFSQAVEQRISYLRVGLWPKRSPVSRISVLVHNGQAYRIVMRLVRTDRGVHPDAVVESQADLLPATSELADAFQLTEREAEVALLIGLRRTNDEIAQDLMLSPHTVRRHTERVMAKLQVESRLDVEALLRGLAPSLS